MRVLLSDRVLLQPLTGVGHYVAELAARLSASRNRTQSDPMQSELAPADLTLTGCVRDVLRLLPVETVAPVERESGPAAHVAHATRETSATPSVSGSPARPIRRVIESIKQVVRPLTQVSYAALVNHAAREHDLYHEPNHIPCATSIPTVTTIHDLSAIDHPQWHPADRIRWYVQGFERGLRQTQHFITVSHATARRLTEVFGIAANRISVTHLAPRVQFTRLPRAAVLPTLARRGLPERFFLFVGTLEPRKNIRTLLDAYRALPQATRRRQPLVLAGGWGWNTADLRAALEQHATDCDIRHLGYCADAELVALYSTATALVWPTLYEGFGLPPLEALACGCPVITSCTTSLPEVVGDFGALLDPMDVDGFTDAMRAADQSNRGDDGAQTQRIAHARRFSWAKCAAQTAAAYRRCLDGASTV